MQAGINSIKNWATHVYESEACMGRNYNEYFFSLPETWQRGLEVRVGNWFSATTLLAFIIIF